MLLETDFFPKTYNAFKYLKFLAEYTPLIYSIGTGRGSVEKAFGFYSLKLLYNSLFPIYRLK